MEAPLAFIPKPEFHNVSMKMLRRIVRGNGRVKSRIRSSGVQLFGLGMAPAVDPSCCRFWVGQAHFVLSFQPSPLLREVIPSRAKYGLFWTAGIEWQADGRSPEWLTEQGLPRPVLTKPLPASIMRPFRKERSEVFSSGKNRQPRHSLFEPIAERPRNTRPGFSREIAMRGREERTREGRGRFVVGCTRRAGDAGKGVR